MSRFSLSLRELFASPWRHRALVLLLIRRDVAGRYRGSALGMLWSFFNPLFMLAVYTFVFSVIFKARWHGEQASQGEFALVLFAGLIVFNFFAECVTRASTLVVTNANYVKKVLFPLEILPWVTLGSATFHALISLGVWVLAHTLLLGLPKATILLLPCIYCPLALLTLGACWFLAALGVYLRDVAQVVTLLTSILMFLSPIFYPISAIPEDYRAALLLNPLMPAIEYTRGLLLVGSMPPVGMLGLYTLVSMVIAWLGFAWFQKTRTGFADVI